MRYCFLLLAAGALLGACSNGSTETREGMASHTIVGNDNRDEDECVESDSFYVNYLYERACYCFVISGESDNGRSLEVTVGVDRFGDGETYFQNEQGKWTHLEVEFSNDGVIEGFDADGEHYLFKVVERIF